MRIFSGCFRTTDGRAWAVGFSALNWEDAESLAEIMNLRDLGELIGTFPATHEDPPDMANLDRYPMQPPVPYFCAWHFRDGKFVNEDCGELP